ncbi:MAG: hypothetical protein RLZZ324_1134 [Candidatus Parcubacteria bacterium]|jgi:hypothetical protein
MVTKTPAKKADMKKKAESWRKFAKIYNNFADYYHLHDLFRGLYPESGVTDAKKQLRVLKRKIEAYRAFDKAHPEFDLEALIERSGKNGTVIEMPEGVRKQLAEYSIDEKLFKNCKGVIVTGAQYGAPLNKSVWAAFKRYAEYMDYVLVAKPIEYGKVKTKHQKETRERVLTSTFDPALKGHMHFGDKYLADGMLCLKRLRMRPTLDKFLTNKICNRGGSVSQIYAAPKLELAHRQRSQHDYPKAIMTTGAVTYPFYAVDNMGQQDRTGEIATAEHTYAAIVVEFSASKTFHYRQLLSSSEGEFYDIDPIRGGAVYVTPKGIEHRPNDIVAAYLGDWHSGVTHPDVKEITFKDMLKMLRVKKAILGDLFNGHSISHHDTKHASRRVHLAERGLNSVRTELELVVSDLKWMHETYPEIELHTIASNHNDVFARYLEEERWHHDDTNKGVCAQIFGALYEDLKDRNLPLHEINAKDPVNWWINQHAPFVKTHGRRDSLLLPDTKGCKIKIECALHGDIGPNGAKKASMDSFQGLNQWAIIGHMHSAAIIGPIWRVGTSTYLTEHYVSSPKTNWTHTHALIYANGQRQLINIVNGAWHGQRKQRPKSAGAGAEKKTAAKARKHPAKAA